MRLWTMLVVLGTAGNVCAQDVGVSIEKYGGSGVAIAQKNDKTLVVSCNHIFAEQLPNGQYPLADYPMDAAVWHKGKVFVGHAVGGCEKGDIAFIVVDGKIPVAPLAEKDALPGEAVWNYGKKSKGAPGVTHLTDFNAPSHKFIASFTSISGDSGGRACNARGEVVAIICGRVAQPEGTPARGVPASYIRTLIPKEFK